MNGIELITACDKQVDIEDIVIKKGSVGTLIDVNIEDGRVLFLLDFEEAGTFEWFSQDELEEKF